MALAVASVNVNEWQVREFLDSLLGAPAAIGVAAGQQKLSSLQPYGPLTAQRPATPPVRPNAVSLRLHPRVDAVHPLGEAHTSTELENALQLYRQLLHDVHLEVDEVMVSADKALVTGHQVAVSYVTTLVPMFPLPHQLQHLAAEFLPSLKAGRIPTTVQMKFGKSDAGHPVVTQMSVTFSLLSALLPHLALQPWQQQLLHQVQPHLLQALMGAGSLAAVMEDVGTSLSATWRAWAAVMSATVGKVLSEVQQKMRERAAAAAVRKHQLAPGGSEQQGYEKLDSTSYVANASTRG
eukprot:GHRR01001217.1.p1 GENE.GHRR01001217.1~~GHRR01001217.1.p1  ORF type:complete len:294 (+),score=83.24 GHRR01001217.1:281-1162(+)